MECQCVDVYGIRFIVFQCVKCALYDSWSVSVLFSVLNVCYMTRGVSVC